MNQDGIGSGVRAIVLAACLAFVALALGLAASWLGYKVIGRMWPTPRVFWGLLAVSFILLALGFFLASIPALDPTLLAPTQPVIVHLPWGDAPLIRAESAGFYLIYFSLLLVGAWNTWRYLLLDLYTFDVVFSSPDRIEPVLASRLRCRNVRMAAAMLSGTVAVTGGGALATALILSESDAVVALAVGVLIGALIGAATYAAAYFVMTLTLRRHIIPD